MGDPSLPEPGAGSGSRSAARCPDPDGLNEDDLFVIEGVSRSDLTSIRIAVAPSDDAVEPGMPGGLTVVVSSEKPSDAGPAPQHEAAAAVPAALTGTTSRPELVSIRIAAQHDGDAVEPGMPGALTAALAATAPTPWIPVDPWAGDDVTMAGAASVPAETKPAAVSAACSPAAPVTGWVPVQPWAGDDVTSAGAASAAPAQRPTTTIEPDSDRHVAQAREALAWMGDDRTIGNPDASTRREVAPGSTAEMAAPAPASASWLGDDRTSAGPVPEPGDARRPTDRTMQPTNDVGRGSDAITSGGQSEVPGKRRRSDRLHAIDPETARMWCAQGEAGPLTGRTLGDFQVGTVLGEGGMGMVYRAVQISIARRAALKALPGGHDMDPVLVARFEAEAHAGGVISSPNVVQVYGAGRDGGVLFFAMEYVEGSDLRKQLEQHRAASTKPSPEEVARWSAQAARGLAEAARHGIVHRDIKPQNLLIDHDGTVKIADFGIAKLVGEQGLTVAGAAIGTPSYASPEQGRGADVDERSDLYSLGVVLYELLTLEKPFRGDSVDALVYQHNYAEPKPPRQLAPSVPEGLEAVCMRLLMKDPARRYQAAADLATDLERWLAGHAPAAPAFDPAFGTGADEAMERLLPRRRRILRWSLAAAAVALCMAGAVLWFLSGAETRRSERDAVLRARTALAVLDRVEPVPASASNDIAWLAMRVPAGDPDVTRWRGKIDRVAGLNGSLTRLDQPGDLPASMRGSLARQLTAYIAEVSTADAAAQRWTARLAAMDRQLAGLRTRLADLDAPNLDLAGFARGEADLDRYASLVTTDDADLQRWRGRGVALRERAATLTKSLARLDDPGVVLREATAQELSSDLAAWTALHEAGDARIAPWQRRLESFATQLATLRERLARLDGVELPTLRLQSELADDLVRYRDLVASDDARLRSWSAKMAGTTTEIAALRQRLSALLDPLRPITVAQLDEATQRLSEYRALVSSDDGAVQDFTRRLGAEREDADRLLAAVGRAERPGVADGSAPLTSSELDALAPALDGLSRREALAPARATALARTLETGRALIAGLRRSLAGGPSLSVARDAAERLASLLPADDADLAAFQVARRDWQRLRTQLAPLDALAPPPPGLADLLTAYARLVPPADPDLVRWRARAERLDQLAARLSWIDQPRTPPEDAQTQLTELVQLCGEDDPRLNAGRTRLAKIAELWPVLSEIAAAPTLVAGSTMPARLDALIALIGSDPRAVAAREQLTALAGPSAPAWASGSGRDVYGAYVDIRVADASARLRWLPPQRFVLGSPADELGRDSDEGPVGVTLTHGVWIAASETDQRLWRSVMGSDPARFRDDDRPVESVSYADALAFCTQLRQRLPGCTARLPSEAEWEAAARAGESGASAGALADIAWHGRTTGTRPIGLGRPNRLGLYDMLGNVWEWCADAHAPYPATDLIDPLVERGDARVLRGGSWTDPAPKVRLANRTAAAPPLRSSQVGFRIVCP